MLVSHQAQFIYLKTFKTASTSVEMALETFCRPGGPASLSGTAAYYNGPLGIVAERGSRDPEVPFRAHIDAKVLKSLLGSVVWDSYTKICTVRNPYDKAVSWFWHQHGKEPFLAEPENADYVVNAFRTWLRAGHNLPKDAKKYMIRKKRVIDLAIRFETMQADLDNFLAGRGKPPVPIPRNKTRFRTLRLPFRDYYDAASAEIVAEHAYLDFANFGYDVASWRSLPNPVRIDGSLNSSCGALSASDQPAMVA